MKLSQSRSSSLRCAFAGKQPSKLSCMQQTPDETSQMGILHNNMADWQQQLKAPCNARQEAGLSTSHSQRDSNIQGSLHPARAADREGQGWVIATCITQLCDAV